MKPAVALLCASLAFAQADDEQASLQKALGEAGSSQVDFIRALEIHLSRYPKTAQRAELERALVKTAIEIRDQRRVIQYGEKVLESEPVNIELLERVPRYLLGEDTKERAEKALGYARRLEETAKQAAPSPGMRNYAQLAEQQQMLLGKALLYQSRASGNLGKVEDAEKLARRAYETFPGAEAAREIGRWLDRQGKTEAALAAWADAFTLADPSAGMEDRRKDRARLGATYQKLKGSEAGLGELLLASYDRTTTIVDAYRSRLRKLDPNAEVRDPMGFTISAVNGEKLSLATLKGKVVVFDVWATWCGPCRQQQPLYEQVKEKYKSNPKVVFLNISTDEAKELVKPFLERNKWNKTAYFEDGLASLLRVSSIPTTVIVNPRGEIASRMNGFIAERFVEMLSERIDQSLKEN